MQRSFIETLIHLNEALMVPGEHTHNLTHRIVDEAVGYSEQVLEMVVASPKSWGKLLKSRSSSKTLVQ